MTRETKICRECSNEFRPIKKNRVNCSSECFQIQKKKQYPQRIGALPASKPTSESGKIRMPKPPMPYDGYNWEMIDSLKGNTGYG